MTVTEKYTLILANITGNAPVDLDIQLFADDTALKEGPVGVKNAFPPSSGLWERGEDLTSYIGVRVKLPIEQPHVLAANLAAAAAERQIVPVFLSWIGNCGMQQFGFRVERISGTSDAKRMICEQQVARFWNLALVVDAAEVSGLR